MGRHKGNSLVKDILRLVRWGNLVIILLTQLFVAIFLIGPAESWLEYLRDYRLWVLISSTIMLAAGGYIINDYYDVKIDIINRPGKQVVGRSLSRRQALIIHLTLTISGILLGLLCGLRITAINVLAGFLLWFYSNSLKRLALAGNIAVSFLTSLSILVVPVLYQKNFRLVVTYAVFAFFVSLIREIIKDVEDVKGDQVFGCATLPIKYGVRKTKKVIYITLAILGIALEIVASRQGLAVILYFNLLIIAPLIYFTNLLIKADTRKDFSFLSTFCKAIMICGVISMFFI